MTDAERLARCLGSGEEYAESTPRLLRDEVLRLRALVLQLQDSERQLLSLMFRHEYERDSLRNESGRLHLLVASLSAKLAICSAELTRMAEVEGECKRLREWKASAVEVFAKLDALHDAMDGEPEAVCGVSLIGAATAAIRRLHEQNRALAERVAAQSELLSRKAER